MRNVLLGMIAVIASAVLPAPPASAAHVGGAKPRLKIVSFQPQTKGLESQLTVQARDPDGVIWEVFVEWGDGGASWATTGCVQGHEPGTVARLIIPHSYVAPGRYRIRAEASSLQHCPFDGPGGTEQHSPAKALTVRVTVPGSTDG